MTPVEVYYRSCEGDWTGPFAVRRLDLGEAVAHLGLLRGLGMWLLYALGARWPARVDTTVRVAAGVRADHTTLVRWLGLPLLVTREAVFFDPGPVQRFVGEERTLIGWRAVPDGTVEVDPDGTRAAYALSFAGRALAQQSQTDGRPPLRARQVRIWQQCTAFDAEWALERA